MARVVLAICAAALLCAGASAAASASVPAVQEVTIDGAGGVQLACGFVQPVGTPPDAGWPAIVVFPGFIDEEAHRGESSRQVGYAYHGFASVSCDERGTNDSGGSFDLAGPQDAADAQQIFDWLAAQPGVSSTQIGAYGKDIGGAEVWDAAVHGVPFKAIVPVRAWSSLARLLHPSGGTDVGFMKYSLTDLGTSTWDTPSSLAARSYRAGIGSLTVPALIVHHRGPDAIELTQATAAYRLLSGPKRLLVTWDDSVADNEALAWFQEYLAGGLAVGQGVEIEHDEPDKTTSTFSTLPATRSVSVNLAGTTLKRHVWLPGGPLETFGSGSVTIRYSHASWKQVVVTITAGKAFVSLGAMPVTQAAGVMKIPLMNWMTLLPGRTKLVLRLMSHDTTFGGTSGGSIDVGRVTLKLSVLRRAVSH